MSRLFEELQRRNVIKVGVTYAVAAWVLLQVVDLLVPILEWSDSVARITLYALVIGFPITLLLSWFYELTPDGISLDEDVDRNASRSRVVDQRLNLIVIALLCAAVILFAYDKWWPDEISDPSIAVLPFANMSGLEENEYFSDGLPETLLHVLAQIPELRVSARTSSFAFKNKNMDVRDIAEQLGVAHVLEGSVQRVGNNVRITVQLIRATDGTHLWSAQYDRRINDIFDIQTEIAATVGAALTRSLLGDADIVIPEGIATRDIEAFDLYLRALAEFNIGSFETLQNAEKYLKNALVKDPSFTDAKALLAQAYVNMASTGAMNADAGFAQAAAFYEQVLLEQPNHIGARAHFLILQTIEAVESGNFGARIAAIEQFGELVDEAPNSVEARKNYANILANNAMYEEAIEQLRITIEHDQVNPSVHFMLGRNLKRARQWDAARHHLDRSLQLQPGQPNVVVDLAQVDLHSGNAVNYVRHVQTAIELDPLDYELPYLIAELLYELELIDEGDRIRDQVVAIAPNSAAAQSLQIIRAIRADSEKESLAVARQLIRDDASNRRGEWRRAFRHLMLTAVLRDRTQDELKFVQEYSPDFADWSIKSIPWKVGLGRAQTLEIWRDLDTDDGILKRIDYIVDAFATINFKLSQVPIVHIDVWLLQGELEDAINAALTHMYSQSVLENLDNKDRFGNPLYTDFVADPRIAAAMQRWEDEWAQAREDVSQYLASQE